MLRSQLENQEGRGLLLSVCTVIDILEYEMLLRAYKRNSNAVPNNYTETPTILYIWAEDIGRKCDKKYVAAH